MADSPLVASPLTCSQVEHDGHSLSLRVINEPGDRHEALCTIEPAAVFELFGDSSLNFTLRLYLPRPELRLEMTHRINTLIHDRFLNAGIAIPFPQRDLHVRSIDPSIPLGPKTMPGE